jgi:hypothetical protein
LGLDLYRLTRRIRDPGSIDQQSKRLSSFERAAAADPLAEDEIIVLTRF